MRNTFRFIGRSFGRATISALVLAGLIALGAPASSDAYLPGEEAHVLDMVNATRSKKGLGTLKMKSELVKMARGQADKMAAKGDIFHNDDLGGDMTSYGLDWRRVGENVGMGPNVDVIEEAFLDSPHHYENIVYPTYDHAGIGVVDGKDGKRYVVQVFADLANTATFSAPKTTTEEPKKSESKPAAPATEAPAAPVEPAPTPAKTPEPVSAVPNALLEGIVTHLASYPS
jgi:hypothetical protein